MNQAKKSKQMPGQAEICYDDTTNTIAANVKRKVDQINNPLYVLAQVTSKNNTTLAFTTKAPRFSAKIQDEETYIGPGYYEQKSCFEKSRSTVNTRAKTNASTQGLHMARSMQQINTASGATVQQQQNAYHQVVNAGKLN